MQTEVIQQRARLQELAGEWKGAGSVEVAGSSFPVTARWLCEPVAAGFGLRCEARIAGVPGLEELIDIEVFGYDDADQQLHAGTVCNVNEAHHLVGTWSGDGLTVEDSRESFAVRLLSATELELRVVNKGGGAVFDIALAR
jgi:hypothetical protein